MPTAIAGNAVTLKVGKQTAKGTPQATPTYALRYTGGFGPAPARDINDLAETDASQFTTGSFVGGARVEGSSEHYVRPDEFGLIAYLAMGANADSGTNPNYTHTATAVAGAPYATLFKAVNSTSLVDRYSDCRISQLTVRGGVGQALTQAIQWGGLAALLGATDPVLAAVTTAPLVYPQVTCTIGGTTPGTVESFELTINNNGSFFQGDTGLAAGDYIFGRRVVSGSMTLLFENDQQYRAFHTGTTGGTAPTSTIYTQAMNILAQVNTNLSVAFDMTNVETRGYDPQLNTDGAPIRAAYDFQSRGAGATAAQYLSIITKSAVASY